MMTIVRQTVVERHRDDESVFFGVTDEFTDEVGGFVEGRSILKNFQARESADSRA